MLEGVLAGHDIVVMGASSGGVEAIMKLVGGLPADLPAAVLSSCISRKEHRVFYPAS